MAQSSILTVLEVMFVLSVDMTVEIVEKKKIFRSKLILTDFFHSLLCKLSHP